MGVDGVLRSDAEWLLLVRCSAWDTDRCGLCWRSKPRRIVCARGILPVWPRMRRAPSAFHPLALVRSRHRPVGSPFDPSCNTDQGV